MNFRISFFENIGPGYLWRFRLLPAIFYRDSDRKPFYFPVNIFLHIFWRSDHDRALHDHPWPSVSFKLWGNMEEVYWEPLHSRSYFGVTRRRKVLWFLPVFRPALWRHRIVLKSKFSVTLFCVGFKQRTWGFWPNGKFVPWREYLELNDRETID